MKSFFYCKPTQKQNLAQMPIERLNNFKSFKRQPPEEFGKAIDSQCARWNVLEIEPLDQIKL